MPGVSPNAASSISQCRLSQSLAQAIAALELNLFADRGSYPPLLQRCGREQCLASARRIHAHLARSGFKDDIFLANLLVQTYARCSSLADARRAFDAIARKNAFSWNIMIAAYAQAGHSEQAFGLFDRMWHLGVRPVHRPVLALLLRGIHSLESLRTIHSRIRDECSSDRVLSTALVRGYGGFRCVEEARRAFDDLRGKRDALCWTALIAAYAQSHRWREAMEAFRAMDSAPDEVAFVTAVDASAAARDLRSGEWLHRRIQQEGLIRCRIVATALLTLYGRCGRIDAARELFDRLGSADVIAWNAMIAAYAHNGLAAEAIETFEAMDLAPNAKTFATVLDACASVGALDRGRAIHARLAASPIELDTVIGTALVNLYAKCGALAAAREIFSKIALRDPVAWSCMISALAHSGHSAEALELFWAMTEEENLEPDSIVFLGVLSACSHGGMIDEGFKHFLSMREEYHIQPAMEHYSCVIDLLGRTGRIAEAEELIRAMPFDPNEVAWSALLNACRIHGEVERGIAIAEGLLELQPENSEAYIAIANIFSAAEKEDVIAVPESAINIVACDTVGSTARSLDSWRSPFGNRSFVKECTH